MILGQIFIDLLKIGNHQQKDPLTRNVKKCKLNMRNDTGGYDNFNSFTAHFTTRLVRCP